MSEVHSYVYGLALKVFQDPKFGQLWDTLNRHSHDAVIDVLTGKQSPRNRRSSRRAGRSPSTSPGLNNLISRPTPTV